MVNRKMYITGGIGSRHEGEAFEEIIMNYPISQHITRLVLLLVVYIGTIDYFF